jgi:Ca-activated chloride channel family protein
MTVKLRYKDPDADKSKLITQSIKKEEVTVAPEGDFAFAAAVAEFGLLLRNSEFKKNASYGHVLKIAKDSFSEDPFGYRSELLDLVKKAKMLDTRSQGNNGIQFKN